MSFIDPLYLVFLLTGFTVGFGHCVGMCGPIVVSLSLNLKGRNVYLPHLLYNAGRVTTYTLLGGLMGATGSFSMVAANIVGIQQGALIFAGSMLIIMALAMSGWLPLGKIFGDYYNPEGFVVKGFQKLSRIDSVSTYFPVGLLLGTVPALFLIAKLVDMGWLKNRQIIYRIGTVLMLIVGVYFIYQGITF